MKYLILLLVLTAGCAEYPTQNVVVTHRVELEQIGNEIERLCSDAYNADIEINDCIQETMQSILSQLGGVQ